MSGTRFSIIVPVYNVEKHIGECIESVLNQDFDNYELILVDDGSKDNSGSICDKYSKSDDRIKVIHKGNGGLVSARKAGVFVAQGQYTLTVDGDDYIRKDALTLFDQIINSNDVDLICYNICLLYSDRIVENGSYDKSELYSKEAIHKKILPYLIENKEGNYFENSICGKVFKTELYKKYQVLVDDRIKIGEDAACTKPLIFSCSSMYILKEHLYFYRQNNASMTKNREPFSLEAPRLIGEHFERTIDLSYGDNRNQVYRLVVHHLFNACCSQYYRNDSKRTISSDISKTLSDSYYTNVVKKCKYSLKNIKGNMALLCLKLRLYALMSLYCKKKAQKTE